VCRAICRYSSSAGPQIGLFRQRIDAGQRQMLFRGERGDGGQGLRKVRRWRSGAGGVKGQCGDGETKRPHQAKDGTAGQAHRRKYPEIRATLQGITPKRAGGPADTPALSLRPKEGGRIASGDRPPRLETAFEVGLASG